MMNLVVRCMKAIYRLGKAWLGLPYVSMGIVVLLVLTWFTNSPNLIFTAALMFAFPVSWLCRLQCEREQRLYKKLYMDCKKCRPTSNSTQTSSATVKNCPVCNKTVSVEYNFCPYCSADFRGLKLQFSEQKIY